MNKIKDLKILIAGAGSIGSVVGCLLASTGHEVKMLRKNAPFGKTLIRITGQLEITEPLEVINAKDIKNKKFDVIFIATQEQQTKAICQELQKSLILDKSTIFVSLQNGLSPHLIIKEHFLKNSIILGVIWWSATMFEPDLILYHRKGETILGTQKTRQRDLYSLETVFNLLDPILLINKSDDIISEIRKKFILNVVSPILALTKESYPEGLSKLYLRDLVHCLFDDALTVAQKNNWDVQDTKLNDFHDILLGKIVISAPESTNPLKHKVSTQIGIEKYGGELSNVKELLGYFALNGSTLAQNIIDLVIKLPSNYNRIDEKTILKLTDLWKGECIRV